MKIKTNNNTALKYILSENEMKHSERKEKSRWKQNKRHWIRWHWFTCWKNSRKKQDK